MQKTAPIYTALELEIDSNEWETEEGLDYLDYLDSLNLATVAECVDTDK